jgi:hypothetical protein
MSTERARMLETLLDLPSAKSKTEPDENAERFFGFLTGVQDRADNIEFRKASGAWVFREYSYLIGGEQAHAGEFTLRFATGETFIVRGRHLRGMYEKILRHRIVWVRDGHADENAGDDEPFVDEIAGPIESRGQEGI